MLQHFSMRVPALACSAAIVCAASAPAQNFHFAPAATRACTPDHLPTRVLVTDVDGDGHLDLLIPGRDTNKVVDWVPLDAAGAPGVMQSFAAPGQTDAAVVGDFNGDGVPDLAFAVRAYAGKVAVYLRDDGGLATTPLLTALDREPRSLVAGDWDGDGDTDLAALQYGNQAALILRNDGTGHFEVSQRLPIEPWSGGIAGPQELLVGDVNGDGRADLVGTMLGTRRIDVFLSNGDGTFANPVAWMAANLANGSRPGITTAALGDFDGDGDLDVAATLIASSGTQPLQVFLNDGHGNFDQYVRFEGAELGYGWGTAVGDLDGDGDLDVVTGTALPGGLYVWENTTRPDGPVEFAPPQSIGTGNFVRDICIANVDSDCDLDVVYAEIANNSVRVYRQLRTCGAALGSFAGTTALKRRGVPLGADADAYAASAKLGQALAAHAADASELALLLGTFGGPPDRSQSTASFGTPDSCGPAGPGGRCDEVHATPGCFTTPCCQTVCGFLPDCCTAAWDQLCVDIAADECDGMVCPQYGPCDQVHDDPGCEDPACCGRITRLDGYCGELWDHICVERVAELCGTSACTITVPPGAISENEFCYQHVNDGPNWLDDAAALIACGDTVTGGCTAESPRDADWYALPGSGRRRVRLEVQAEFPCEVHLVRGPFQGPLTAVQTAYGGQCAPVTLDACLDGEGPWYAVITLGTPAGAIRQGQPCTLEDPRHPWPPDYTPPEPGFYGERYVATLTCSNCAHPADLNGDGTVDGADLGALLGDWGFQGVHPTDLNGDGLVDGGDLGVLLGAWGPVP